MHCFLPCLALPSLPFPPHLLLMKFKRFLIRILIFYQVASFNENPPCSQSNKCFQTGSLGSRLSVPCSSGTRVPTPWTPCPTSVPLPGCLIGCRSRAADGLQKGRGGRGCQSPCLPLLLACANNERGLSTVKHKAATRMSYTGIQVKRKTKKP